MGEAGIRRILRVNGVTSVRRPNHPCPRRPVGADHPCPPATRLRAAVRVLAKNDQAPNDERGPRFREGLFLTWWLRPASIR